MPPGLSVWLAGATGLVGAQILQILLADSDYSQVSVLGRRAPPVSDDKLRVHAVDFERLDASPLVAPDQAICCLGTTRRAAGSAEQFRKVDHDYVVAFAALARAAGARRFVVLSSLGADAASRIFYNRVKGEMEDSVVRAGPPEVFVLRPSLLLGTRTERRPGERLAQALARPLAPLFRGRFARHRPIDANVVARAAVRLAKQPVAAGGLHVVESEELADLGHA
jgi:uncharacterized protein YbjT (DUF2867 family)